MEPADAGAEDRAEASGIDADRIDAAGLLDVIVGDEAELVTVICSNASAAAATANCSTRSVRRACFGLSKYGAGSQSSIVID